jgi:hypothetical protein
VFSGPWQFANSIECSPVLPSADQARRVMLAAPEAAPLASKPVRELRLRLD